VIKKIRNIIRSIVPQGLLDIYRNRKKEQVRKDLAEKKQRGKIISKEQLISELRKAGIQPGDTLLVHSSMSKIGYLENGPKTLVDALLETLDTKGNLLMPTSPNASFQIEYARNNPVFDVLNTPSKLGSVTEYFRKLPNVKRSAHPTEPVAALGPDAQWLTEGHLGELTPYTSHSPFSRIYNKNGKILYLGVTLDNAGTNLHTLEDAVDFKYPVYADELFPFTIIDQDGKPHEIKTRVHNPEFSKRRRCDELLPMFEKEGVAKRVHIGEATAWLFDGKKMFETMISAYNTKGITMYTPNGEKIIGFD
jgi:aminoglycoside 3-N-acetyltransferase